MCARRTPMNEFDFMKDNAHRYFLLQVPSGLPRDARGRSRRPRGPYGTRPPLSRRGLSPHHSSEAICAHTDPALCVSLYFPAAHRFNIHLGSDVVVSLVATFKVDRDLAVVRDLGLTLVAAINTHAHADHVTGTGLLKTKPEWGQATKSMISAASGAMADVALAHGDTIKFGTRCLRVRAVGAISRSSDGGQM